MSELKPGTRIKLIDMPDDPNPLPPGTTGTVVRLGYQFEDKTRQIFVNWDIDRSLILIQGIDRFEIMEEPCPSSG